MLKNLIMGIEHQLVGTTMPGPCECSLSSATSRPKGYSPAFARCRFTVPADHSQKDREVSQHYAWSTNYCSFLNPAVFSLNPETLKDLCSAVPTSKQPLRLSNTLRS